MQEHSPAPKSATESICKYQVVASHTHLEDWCMVCVRRVDSGQAVAVLLDRVVLLLTACVRVRKCMRACSCKCKQSQQTHMGWGLGLIAVASDLNFSSLISHHTVRIRLSVQLYLWCWCKWCWCKWCCYSCYPLPPLSLLYLPLLLPQPALALLLVVIPVPVTRRLLSSFKPPPFMRGRGMQQCKCHYANTGIEC